MLDCPPVMGVAETTILVTKADAVILVVDARKFTFENLEQGLAHLRASGANVVGIVLNRVRWRKMGPVYGYEAPLRREAADSLMDKAPKRRDQAHAVTQIGLANVARARELNRGALRRAGAEEGEPSAAM